MIATLFSLLAAAWFTLPFQTSTLDDVGAALEELLEATRLAGTYAVVLADGDWGGGDWGGGFEGRDW